MTARVSIFDFQSPTQYLREAGRGTRSGRALTYSQWARSLRYRSPRGIAMVMQGKRLPSPDMLQRLSGYLGHSETEHRYLEILVEREKQKLAGKPVDKLERELWQINPKAVPAQPISLEEFALISRWFFYVVKQMVDAPGFREDYQWIQKRLRNKISVTEIRSALRVLSELGLIERDPASGKLRSAKRSVRPPQDVPSAALRHQHREHVERGLEAMEEQPQTNKEFYTLTLRVNPADIRKIQETIRGFAIQFDKRFEDLSSDRVYQLNLQFFEHTDTNAGKKR